MVLVWRIKDDSPNLPNFLPAKLSCYTVCHYCVVTFLMHPLQCPDEVRLNIISSLESVNKGIYSVCTCMYVCLSFSLSYCVLYTGVYVPLFVLLCATYRGVCVFFIAYFLASNNHVHFTNLPHWCCLQTTVVLNDLQCFAHFFFWGSHFRDQSSINYWTM